MTISAWSTCFLICSYTLREDAVETHWARCVHAVDVQWQLFARHEHAVSALWLRSQSPARTPWERGGTPWALLGNTTVAVGAPWHLHVMENIKLFAIFFSIFVQSHGALRNFKSPCQCRGIAAECDRGFTKEVNSRLAKCPLVFNGHLANRRLTSLVKEATGVHFY